MAATLHMTYTTGPTIIIKPVSEAEDMLPGSFQLLHSSSKALFVLEQR